VPNPKGEITTFLSQDKVLAAIISTADRVLAAAECSGDERRHVARLVALAHGEESLRLAKTGQDLGKRLQVLEAGERFARPWQLMAAIGDLKQEVKSPEGQIHRSWSQGLE
jgi:hypothetical protein